MLETGDLMLELAENTTRPNSRTQMSPRDRQ